MKTLKALSLAVIAAVSLAAQADAFKVGSMSGKEADLVKAAAKVAKEKYNLDVEVVEFDDYIMPNVALAEGDIDANAFQHKPYMDAMVKDRGFKFKAVGNTFIYPIGAYSQKIKDIKDLKDGAKIAFPNDPSNGARSLIMMDKAGLIKLKDNTNLEASKLDVVENPHHFELIDAEAATLPRVLPDVDLAFINSNYAVDADLVPTRDAVIIEPKESPYVNLIVVRDGDENRKEVKEFVDAYHSKAVEDAAENAFKGAAVKGW